MSPLPPPPPPPPGTRRDDQQIQVNRYDHARSHWGLGDAWISMAIFFGLSLAIGLTYAVAMPDAETLEGAWLPVAIALPPLVQLGYVIWVSRAKGTGLRNDFQLKVTPSDLGIGAGLCISGLILAGITAALVMTITGEEPSAAAADLAQDSEGGNGLTLSLYVFAVLAATLIPLVEEVVFRGLWWSALEKRGMSPVWILIATSAIFAVVHLEPLRTPVLFVLGMVIGLGRLTTGRIGASIFAHAYVNAIGMIFLLIDLS